MDYKYQKITYAIITVVLGLALSSSFITSALAANAHFVGAEPQVRIVGDSAVSDPFKVAGLGGGQTLTTTVTVQGSAEITCTSSGQQKNQDKPSPGLTRPITDSTSVPVAVPKNGQVTQGSVTASLDISDVDTTNACPNPKFRAVVTDITVTGATLTISTSSGDFFYQDTFP